MTRIGFLPLAALPALLLSLLPAHAAELRCGTPAIDLETAALVERLIVREKLERGALGIRERTIPVAFHIIQSGPLGRITNARIRKQVRSMTAAFRGTGFAFRLHRVDRTDNALWYRECLAHEAAMKRALAVDPRRVLNVYVCEPTRGGNLGGIARYPWEFPEDSFLHGAIVNPLVVLGSSLQNYGIRGNTVIHEVGHYLGLFHTFESGCADGDFVPDTPAQAGPVRDCRPGEIDTCAGPGFDDIRNYMNYGDDVCRNHFTPGQAERMQLVVSSARPSL